MGVKRALHTSHRANRQTPNYDVVVRQQALSCHHAAKGWLTWHWRFCFSQMMPQLQALQESTGERFVTVTLELRGWEFIQHRFKLRVDTPMYSIKVRGALSASHIPACDTPASRPACSQRKLVEKHGRMAELTLYKSIDAKSNAITNDKWTLQEIGIDGAPAGAPEATATIM